MYDSLIPSPNMPFPSSLYFYIVNNHKAYLSSRKRILSLTPTVSSAVNLFFTNSNTQDMLPFAALSAIVKVMQSAKDYLWEVSGSRSRTRA